VVSVGATLWGLPRRAPGRRWAWVRERYGLHSYARADVWVHAVSVGESIAAVPLVSELRRRHPEWKFVFTTVTETGRAVAADRFEDVDVVSVPWDVGPVVRRVLRRTSPRIVVCMETEIWPAFIREAARLKIPFVVANGRISEGSFRGYMRLRPAMKSVFGRVAGFAMQTGQDAERVVALGAPPERVLVLGNLKYDVPVPPAEPPAWAGVLPGPVLVAGSTHRGEDEIVLTAFERARAAIPDLSLILAPRHPERFDEVADLVTARGFRLFRRSAFDGGKPEDTGEPGVVLLDAMGELAGAYGAADVCFVGGSLTPNGGHNILEAVVWERPVLVGPYTNNFSEMTRFFEEAGGLVRVSSAETFAEEVVRLVRDSAAAARLTEAAAGVLKAHRGAAVRMADWIDAHVARTPYAG